MLDWLSVFGARDDVRDHWAHKDHKAEVTKLLETIFECSEKTKRPVVILSGDVHIGGVFTLFRKNAPSSNARVYQVTSSAITYAAVGPAKMKLLAKAVARKGEIGARDDEEEEGCGFCFRNHVIFPQHNFGLVRYRTDGAETSRIDVELVGRSDDGRVRECIRRNLLELE